MTASILLDHLWQSTLCAIAAGLLALALRNNEARIRYWVWFAASVKFLVPFSLLSLVVGRFHWQHASAAPLVASAVGFQVLLAIWALGCAFLLSRWLTIWMRVSATVRSAVPAEIAAPIPVRLSSARCEPGVVGILRPVLLLPAGITERLTTAQLQAVLAHEFCHVRRRDNLTAAVHMVLEVAFWFHPLIWWIGARLVEERERACDEAVLNLGNDSQTYAEGILRVCQFYVESQLTCIAGVSGSNLKKRVELIMRHSVMEKLSIAQKILLAMATAAAFALPIAVGLTTAPLARAEAAPEAVSAQHAFDAVSVVANAPSSAHLFRLGVKGGTLSTTGVPLRTVIAYAYGVDPSRVVGGAAWLDKPLYDIVARTTDATTAKRGGVAFSPMVRGMLVARFGLLAHPEIQRLPVYVLRVDVRGSKLNTSTEPKMIRVGPNLLMSTAGEIKDLTAVPAKILGRPVVDETGLTGAYDFALTGALNPKTLPTLLRDQLGLTIEPVTAPVDMIVVDSVQRPTLDTQSLPVT